MNENSEIDPIKMEKYDNNTKNQINLYIHSDLSKFKSKRLFGITFYQIGNFYSFDLINNSLYPLFCINKSFYYNLIIYIVEILVYFVGNNFLYNKLEKWKQITFNILLITFFIFYSILILINPGIVIRSKKGEKGDIYCNICNIYYLPEENIKHCKECNICVRNIDHHCQVVNRCITKRNLIIFFFMVTNFIVVYGSSVVQIIIICIDYYKKKIKKIK